MKLGVIKNVLDDTVAEAEQNQWGYRRFLRDLLQREIEHRVENRKYQRIRKAGFPQMKYLQELVLEDLPSDTRNLLPELESMNFVKQGRNIVMYGNPGTGKTHTAIGLGIKACMEGFDVFFTTVPHLLTRVREAKNNKTLQLLETRFKKFDLVICDEMGYVSFDKEELNYCSITCLLELDPAPPLSRRTCLLQDGRKSSRIKSCARRSWTDFATRLSC